MITALLTLLVLEGMILLVGLALVIGYILSREHPMLKIGRKAAKEIDKEIDYYAELHRIISDLVDGKD